MRRQRDKDEGRNGKGEEAFDRQKPREARMKAKVELTAEAVRKAIEEKKPTSMTGLAHGLGYKGSVGGSLTKKFRALTLPWIRVTSVSPVYALDSPVLDCRACSSAIATACLFALALPNLRLVRRNVLPWCNSAMFSEITA